MMVNDNTLFQKNAVLLNPSLASQLLQKALRVNGIAINRRQAGTMPTPFLLRP